MKQKSAAIIFLVLMCASLASCGLFRKKNKCMSCPTWHDEVVVDQPAPVLEEKH